MINSEIDSTKLQHKIKRPVEIDGDKAISPSPRIFTDDLQTTGNEVQFKSTIDLILLYGKAKVKSCVPSLIEVDRKFCPLKYKRLCGVLFQRGSLSQQIRYGTNSGIENC